MDQNNSGHVVEPSKSSGSSPPLASRNPETDAKTLEPPRQDSAADWEVNDLLMLAVLEEFPCWMYAVADQFEGTWWDEAVIIGGARIAAVARAIERIERIELNTLDRWSAPNGRLLTADEEAELIRLIAWAVLGNGFRSGLYPYLFEPYLKPFPNGQL